MSLPTQGLVYVCSAPYLDISSNDENENPNAQRITKVYTENIRKLSEQPAAKSLIDAEVASFKKNTLIDSNRTKFSFSDKERSKELPSVDKSLDKVEKDKRSPFLDSMYTRTLQEFKGDHLSALKFLSWTNQCSGIVTQDMLKDHLAEQFPDLATHRLYIAPSGSSLPPSQRVDHLQVSVDISKRSITVTNEVELQAIYENGMPALTENGRPIIVATIPYKATIAFPNTITTSYTIDSPADSQDFRFVRKVEEPQIRGDYFSEQLGNTSIDRLEIIDNHF